MRIQTKTTARAIRQMLIFYLLTVSTGSVADAVTNVKQPVSENRVMENTSQSAAIAPAKAPAKCDPGSSVALLKMVQKNGRQQAAEAAFSLGVMAIENKDFDSAQLLIDEAISLQPSHPKYQQVAASLAFNQGDFSGAEMYQIQSLQLARPALGQDDIRVVMLMDDLGTIYLAQEHYQLAERTWRTSLAMREQILGNMHPSIAPRLKDLAGLAMRDGRFDETEQLLVRTIHILQADVESDQSDVTAARHVLADFYVNRQRMGEADALYQWVLAEWRVAPAQQRLEIAANLYELGNEYLSQLRLEEARSQFELILGLLEGDLEEGYMHISNARTALNKLNVAQKKQDEEGARDQVGDKKPQERLSQRRQ